MAIAVVAGVIVSTLLTLFVVPCFYSLAEEWRERLRRAWRSVFPAKAVADAAAAEQGKREATLPSG